MAKKLRKTTICPNCKLSLDEKDNFCPACGQENTTKNVSLKILVRDILDEFFTFDSRLFKSVFPLLFKPGFLTKEFIEGKRIKFLPPLRIYIIVSIIFFLIAAADEQPDSNELADLGQAVLSDSPKTKPDTLNAHEYTKKTSSHIGFSKDGKTMEFDLPGLDNKKKFKKEEVDSIVNLILDSLDIAKGTFTAGFIERGAGNIMNMIEDDGKIFLSDLENNYPKMMFILLPVFALLLKLLYFRLKPLYVECVIFSLHFHSFAFILYSINDLLDFMGINIEYISLILFLVLCYYLIKSLKNVFGQKYRRTIMKFIGLSFTYGFCTVLAFTLTFLITLLLY